MTTTKQTTLSPFAKKLLAIGVPIVLIVLMIIGLFKFGSILAFMYVYTWLVGQIIGATNVNIWVARAIAIAMAGIFIKVITMCRDKDQQKRQVGATLLICLLSVSCLGMFFATKDHFFSVTTGKAIKYYVETDDGYVISDRPAFDPKTGKPFSLATPEMARRIRAYQGKIQAVNNRNAFFSQVTGEPVKWYFRDQNGRIRISDKPGFDKTYGLPKKEVTPEVVREYERQNSAQKSRTPGTTHDTSSAKTNQAHTKRSSPNEIFKPPRDREENISDKLLTGTAEAGRTVFFDSMEGELVGGVIGAVILVFGTLLYFVFVILGPVAIIFTIIVSTRENEIPWPFAIWSVVWIIFVLFKFA